MGSEVTNDKEKKREITDEISKLISVLTGIISFFVAIINGVMLYFDYNYSIMEEEFYGIPRSYFGYSKLMIFMAIGVYFVFLFLPLISKKIFRVKKFSIFESLMYSLCVCILTAPIVFSSLMFILSTFSFNIEETNLYVVTGAILVLTLLIYMYLFTKDTTSGNKSEKKQDVLYSNLVFLFSSFTRFIVILVIILNLYLVLLVKSGLIFKELLDKIKAFIGKLGTKIRGLIEELPDKINAFIKKLCALIECGFKLLWLFICMVILLILVISAISAVAFRIVENPKNKTRYEIAIINSGDKGNEQYMAIVSYKNGKAILMDCTIITQAAINGKEIKILQLTKGKYRLSDIEGHQIEYKEFDAVKCE